MPDHGGRGKMPIDETALAKLREIVGKDNVATDTATRYVYGSDASIHHHMPDVVVRPASTKEVSELLRYCNEKLIPVTTRGAGTGLSGQTVPVKGGILMEMMSRHMNSGEARIKIEKL